ncbi:cation diffusion facilitator family transporter [Litoreibacter janthinus]|uniref:Cobalt-zinc-cadmium efflux system protein n=1 Tax=Litoreibacter janthinus TaxID=670154 RepID=A0A1I6H7R1_9RHOB|nr:cation diffusion facilitator family transporter [Litoreibacter janthinus]SFR50398.1 cobalt-zinc-cadmium efflux system protein [Litoreibacter janthinus]
MPHDHHHHHISPEDGDVRVAWAIAVNMGLTVLQVVGGILSGSLALIADALHNFSDAVALIIAFAARKIGRKPADATMTFGYRRAETVAALINYTTLIVIGLYLLYEATLRLWSPSPVDGWLVVWIAVAALIVDLVTAALTYSMSKSSMNIRAAFLHNLADALGSVAVIIAGTTILLFDWWLIDPLITFLIAGYILWQSVREIGPVIRVLMLGTPPQLDMEALLSDIRKHDGVVDVHHLHVWQMEEDQAALSAHIVTSDTSMSVRNSLKTKIKQNHGISEIILELEHPDDACAVAEIIGHA